MKLEDQVCSLEQAKKLAELGVVQGCSCWCHLHLPETKYRKEAQIIYTGDQRFTDHGEEYSAFDCAELGVMLPNGFCSGNGINSDKVKWCDKVSSDHLGFDEIIPCTVEDTEAKAKAAMLIYLLERNLTTVEEVTARLTA